MAKDITRYKTEVICPSCGLRDKFIMHTLIDTRKDPDAENKIFQGTYFTHVCRRCHDEENITYSCMYHDGNRKLLIGFADSEKDLEEMRLTLNGQYHRDQVDEVLQKWMNVCTVRLVKSEYQLQEKVLIAHFDLDDRVIELARYAMKQELLKTRDDITGLYFNTTEGGYGFTIGTEEGLEGTIPFTKEMYEEIKEKYHDLLEHDTSIEIDEDWAEEHIL